ncbi:cyclic nucleotide-binding domain-containing protein [Pannonibacter phragmitetus]|uniref:cyclic nucleotide-binding domain-containing protein n=1 Tax=Pannonibacter phragmitetus TaxID=121719 RepID=UPI003D2F0F5E
MEQVVARVRKRAAQASGTPLRFLIIDLGGMSGMDSAAAAGFAKIHGMTERAGVRLIFSAMPQNVAAALARSGLNTAAGEGDSAHCVTCAADLDHALELCEDVLLVQEKLLPAGAEISHHLESILGPHPRLADLASAMDRMELEPGTALIRAGDPADDVFLVGEGRVRVEMMLPDGRSLRLRTMTAGAVVGKSVIASMASAPLMWWWRARPPSTVFAARILRSWSAATANSPSSSTASWQSRLPRSWC